MDVLSLALCLLLTVSITRQHAGDGVCWLSRSKNGLCRQVYNINMSREECCRHGYPTVSWSPQKHVTRATIFFWAALTGGAPQCHACHDTCDNVYCSPDRKCRVRRGQARCVCSPRCPRQLKTRGPVCGTDGNTYRNYCALLRHNCRLRRDTAVSYLGKCKKSCRHVKCFDSSKHCLQDQNGLPHCVHCNTLCPTPTTRSAICGEDGKTYNSYCHLVAAICIKGSSIRLAYKGPCRANLTCEDLNCSEGYKCLVNRTSGLPQCANCRLPCPLAVRSSVVPLCGTDGVTYPSYCSMQKVACSSGVVIKTASFGKCEVNRAQKGTSRDSIDEYFGQVVNTT